MGKINLTSIGGLGFSSNTLNEYDNEVSEELVDHHVERIASIYAESQGLSCYIIGMGGQSRDVYREVSNEVGVEVIWTSSILPGVTKLLSFFMASQAGLIKVLSPEKLKIVFKSIRGSSMAGIYIFEDSLEDQFVKRVTDCVLPKEFDYGVKCDPRYFFYIVDADNAESATGLYEIVSYGTESEFARAM